MSAASGGATAHPFIKWVGGKRQLLPQLVDHLPKVTGMVGAHQLLLPLLTSHLKFTGMYHEPFLGGGALFFHLQPKYAVLSDANLRLIRTYRGIRDAVDEVILLLLSYPYDKDFFLEMRQQDIDSRSDAEVAAWFIYLNKTGFNGLYRVNKRNQFNVPFGDYKNPTICDAENLRACSELLQCAAIDCQDFGNVLDTAHPGDFVYFDPPYVPLSATSSFTSYTSDGFTDKDQARLRDVAVELKRHGVWVLLSNSSAAAVRELYRDFNVVEVSANRAVNCKGEGRGKVKELLIW